MATNTPSSIAVNSITGVNSTFFAQPGQSIYDVCLMVYGSLDYIVKLLNDNNIDGLNNVDVVGQVFIFDSTIRQNTSSINYNSNYRIIYGTLENPPGVYSIELRDDGGYELRDDGGLELR
jgi:hypothetical protein